MEKEVQITVNSLQVSTIDGERQEICEQYWGKYIESANKEYLLYEEQPEDNKHSVKTMIKMGLGEIAIVKRGAINTEMVFKAGVRKLANYETPYGGMTIGIRTENLSVMQNGNSTKIEINYKLEIDYDYVTECHISIEAIDK